MGERSITGPDRYLAALVFQSEMRRGATREQLVRFAVDARLLDVAAHLLKAEDHPSVVPVRSRKLPGCSRPPTKDSP